jgi:CRP/FNR family transcriptional regulator, cyclic AMP receptor protein
MNESSGFQRKIAELTRGKVGWGPRRHRDWLVAAQPRKLEYLTEQRVFAPLSADEKHWLMTNTAMVTCPRGQVFHSPDEPGEVVFILKRGSVDLYRLHPDGRKLVIARLAEGSIFGEMSLIGQRMYGCFAEAAEDCLICVLSRSDLQALVRRNPDVGLEILAELGDRLRERESELEAISFQTVPARLAALLIREADADGILQGLTHQELAERLGTYRETVSQVLGRFRQQGWISVEQRRIEILDRAPLEEIAQI